MRRCSCVVLSCLVIFQSSGNSEIPYGESDGENYGGYSVEYLGGNSDCYSESECLEKDSGGSREGYSERANFENYLGEYSNGYLDGYMDGRSGHPNGYSREDESGSVGIGRPNGRDLRKGSSDVCGKSSDKYDLEGFYVGLGVTYDRFKSRVHMDDNLSQLARFRYSPKDYEKAEGYYYEPDSHGLPVLSANESRFGGNISLGYGEFFFKNSWFTDNCYMGIEFAADVAGGLNLNTEDIVVHHANNPDGKIEFGKCSVKYEDVVPSAALRFGGYVHGLESLVFLRVGCKYLRYGIRFDFFPDQNIRSSVFVPLIGLGIEKNIAHGFTLKAEIDYSFGSQKTHNVYRGNFRNGPDKNYKASLKHRVQGYTARLVGVYHF